MLTKQYTLLAGFNKVFCNITFLLNCACEVGWFPRKVKIRTPLILLYKELPPQWRYPIIPAYLLRTEPVFSLHSSRYPFPLYAYTDTNYVQPVNLQKVLTEWNIIL